MSGKKIFILTKKHDYYNMKTNISSYLAKGDRNG